jgi:hypothetical protein
MGAGEPLAPPVPPPLHLSMGREVSIASYGHQLGPIWSYSFNKTLANQQPLPKTASQVYNITGQFRNFPSYTRFATRVPDFGVVHKKR